MSQNQITRGGVVPPGPKPPNTQVVSGGTVNVTGTVTANAGTNLNTSALALESGGNLAGVNTRIGEVQASPTANTLLDRLKALFTRQGDGSQKTQIVDGSGNVIDSHQGMSGDNHLGTSIIQSAVIVAANSSTSNLNASATFTGTSTATAGINGIQVTLKTDQNCTVYVDQSSNGSNWDIVDSFHYNVIKDNFSTTVQVVSSYFRVRVTNLSSTTATTYFRLQTVVRPVVEPLPRSTYDGSLLTSVYGLRDDFGFSGEFTPMRDLKTVMPIRLVGTTYRASIDANFWTAATSGAGSAATISNAVGTVTSGTANSGYGQISSVRVARFIFAHPLQFRGIFKLSATTTAHNTVYFGAYSVSTTTPQNGVYFSVDQNGLLSVNCVSGGTPNSVSSGSFNGDVSEYALDTNAHAYEIIYFTAGAWFFIDDVLIHKFTPISSILYQSLNVGINYSSVNDASGTTSRSLECWNAIIQRLGRDLTAPTSKYQTGTTAGLTLKIGSGDLHGIVISNVTNNAVVTLYDNTAASGTVLFNSGPMTNNTTPFSVNFWGIPFFTGLTLVISAANCDVTIAYE